ncbi:MAG: putative porin [Sedimentisphaerales bacterium]|nr:putative porin [Sedimentisphaerales bacterium]
MTKNIFNLKCMLIAAAMIFCSVSIGRAGSEEAENLKKQITELSGRITQLEANQKTDNEDNQSENLKLPDSLKWIEKVKISGDFRYRHEHIDTETGTINPDWKLGRDRERIRARLMIEALINDEWDVGFRFATGERSILASDEDMFGDPISANQTLKQYFSDKDLWIDLACFNWHPTSVSGLNVSGGKIKNPFYSVGKNQLIWDGDLNPEGFGVSHSIDLNKSDKLFFNGAGLWVDESSSGADTSLWGAQTYIKHSLENSDYILGGAGYLDYGNIQGKTDTYDILAGNTGSGSWASDFDILELFGEYGTKLKEFPVSVYGSWVNNLVASSNGDTGFIVGAKFNKAGKPGSWELSYDYRELEADAVPGAFTDSDFGGGGTDTRGHCVDLTYQLAKNVQMSTTYFQSVNDGQSGGCDLDYRRLHASLVLKF